MALNTADNGIVEGVVFVGVVERYPSDAALIYFTENCLHGCIFASLSRWVFTKSWHVLEGRHFSRRLSRHFSRQISQLCDLHAENPKLCLFNFTVVTG